MANLRFWYLFKPKKVSWSDSGRRDLREGGGNCLKYLGRGWNRTDGRGHKYFKKGGGASWVKECPPYELWLLSCHL